MSFLQSPVTSSVFGPILSFSDQTSDGEMEEDKCRDKDFILYITELVSDCIPK
jgi:hypothetical protein